MHSREKEFFEDQIKELKDTGRKLRSELEIKAGVEEALMEKKEEIVLLERELDSLRNAISLTEKRASAAEASRAELLKLKEELDDDSEKLLELTNRTSSLQTKVESLREDLDEKNQRILKYENENEKLKNQIRNLEVEVTTSKRYVKENEAELKKKTTKINKYEKVNREIKDMVNKLELERNDLAKKVEKYEKLL